MKKLVQKDEVVIREGFPRRLPHNEKGVIFKGFSVEVVQTLEGEPIEGNNVWYQDKNGDYYWSGGFGEDVVPTDHPTGSYRLGRLVNYNQLLENIPPALRSNKGSGASIAVLDSGCFEDHKDLEGAYEPNSSRDFTNSPHNAQDVFGHGTHISGLIAGRGPDGDGIVGVAPMSKLINTKVLDDHGGSSIKSLKNAYAHFEQHGYPSVINMSLSISKADYQQISSLFQQTKAIQVAAAGNNGTLFQSFGYFNYPAMDTNVISVGVIDDQYLSTNTDFHSELDYVFLRNQFTSTSIQSKGYYHSEDDSSQATALVSGMIALICAASGSTPSLSQVKTQLNSIAIPISEAVQSRKKNQLIRCQ